MNIIHTGLYSPFALSFMTAAVQRIKSYKRSFSKKLDNMYVVQEPTGEVVLKHDSSYCYCNRHITKEASNLNALMWIARTIKFFAKIGHETDLEWWSRDNLETNYMGTSNGNESIGTIRDTYLIYDLLIGRKNLENKYPADLIASIHGTERDAMQTELEIAKREEIARINDRYKALCDDANPRGGWRAKARREIDEKIDAYRKSLEDEAMVAYISLKEEWDKALKDVENMTNFVTDFPFA